MSVNILQIPNSFPFPTSEYNALLSNTDVTRGHFDAWSTDQESPIVVLIWQTRFTEIAVSRKL